MTGRYVYGRVVIDLAKVEVERKQEQARKRQFYLRMKAAGIRQASVRKYLRRGFPGPFVKAIRKELEALASDMKRRWWIDLPDWVTEEPGGSENCEPAA